MFLKRVFFLDELVEGVEFGGDFGFGAKLIEKLDGDVGDVEGFLALEEEIVFHLVLIEALALFFVFGSDPLFDVLEEGGLSAFFDSPGDLQKWILYDKIQNSQPIPLFLLQIPFNFPGDVPAVRGLRNFLDILFFPISHLSLHFLSISPFCADFLRHQFDLGTHDRQHKIAFVHARKRRQRIPLVRVRLHMRIEKCHIFK